MSKLNTVIKDSQILGSVVRNGDGTDSYTYDNWVALTTGVWSPAFSFDAAAGVPGTIQAFVKGTGGASVIVQVSLNGLNWVTLGTITLSTVDGDSGAIGVNQVWSYVRAQIASVGASTTVTVLAKA